MIKIGKYILNNKCYFNIYNCNNISAYEISKNPLLVAITNFFSIPFLKCLIKNKTCKEGSHILIVLRMLMYCIFLYVF